MPNTSDLIRMLQTEENRESQLRLAEKLVFELHRQQKAETISGWPRTVAVWMPANVTAPSSSSSPIEEKEEIISGNADPDIHRTADKTQFTNPEASKATADPASETDPETYEEKSGQTAEPSPEEVPVTVLTENDIQEAPMKEDKADSTASGPQPLYEDGGNESGSVAGINPENHPSKEPESLNDRLKTQVTELSQKLSNEPIRDLKKAINVNDRYQFINELFNGDETMFEKSIRKIQNSSAYPEAEYFIERELKIKMGWNQKSELVRYFDSLVQRRFM